MKHMKLQYNKTTTMFWLYIPKEIIDSLGLLKGDEFEFKKINEKEMLIKKYDPN